MPTHRHARTAGLLFVTGLFLTAIACANLFGTLSGTIPPIAPPSATPRPTATAIPLYQEVQLNSLLRQEHGQIPGYTVNSQTPVLTGSADRRVQAFNASMKTVVDNAVAAFKQNVATLPPSPDSTSSSFQLDYHVLSPPGNILSLKFDIQTFYSGATHPAGTSLTATFDLEGGQPLALADLFVPDTDYLGAVAKYCAAQLSARDIGFQGFELGATATEQNYRNWNITPNGLMITFDEYQVAPYTAGPQTVVIPFRELAGLIQPDGPLAQYLH